MYMHILLICQCIFVQENITQIRGRLLEEMSQKKLVLESFASVTQSCRKPLTSPAFTGRDYSTSGSDSEEQHTNTANSVPAAHLSAKTNHESIPLCRSWEYLPPDIQSVLPSDEEYTYVIQSHQKHEAPPFEGAPEFAFSALIRINLESQEAIQTWLDKMMQTSLCTYRVSRGFKPKGKRVLCKTTMHCQHFRKPLTPTQAARSKTAGSKRQMKPMKILDRQKKTQCPSTLRLTLQVPTQKQKHAATKHPYLLTHRAVLQLQFLHNHPINAAHPLSFRPVSEKTKQQFFDYFSNGHCASSARHTHEQMLLLNAHTDNEKQIMLADRQYNPNVQDICRLFIEWRKSNYGAEDGKQLFKKLQEVVDEYTARNERLGGKALLQWYEKNEEDLSDTDNDKCPPKKKRKREPSTTPLILTICTPLMARAHAMIQQAGEVVFCDSTSSLDRFNTSVFVMSTTTTASGVPLAVALTSDETEETIYKALEMVKEVVPSAAFFGKGPNIGPQLFMIDDSVAEQSAIQRAWPSSRILLCTFHFLQRRWTWLHDARNRVCQNDRVILIGKLKELVYAKTEITLNSLHAKLIKECPESTKYPHFLQLLSALWEKRQSWAHCFRTDLPLRGNHTNNYAEAGMKILKELIFSRVKAYNIVQMFSFVTEVMDMYYQKKLLSLANNRKETYIALRFQGIKADKVAKEDIAIVGNGWYKVRSQTNRDDHYQVHPEAGFCTCKKGRDGSPCIHQAAIVLQHGENGLNYIGAMSSTTRQKIAKIALGEGAIENTSFYSSLHQQFLQANLTESEETSVCYKDAIPLHVTDHLSDLANYDNDNANETTTKTQDLDVEAMCAQIEEVADDLKERLRQQISNEQFTEGTKKFIQRYQALSRRSNAALASALHRFGWVFGGKIFSQKLGHLRHGKRITIQATSAGRRRKGCKRGKAVATSGRPAGKYVDKHAMPVRKEPKGKREHKLSMNISKGQQNAGKW